MNRQQRRASNTQGRRRKGPILAGSSAAALAVASQLVFAPGAHAAEFTVTNLDDIGPGSLRQAVADANASEGTDTITFASELTGTITLTSGQLEILDSVDIVGPGATVLAVDGNHTSRIFYLYNPSADLEVSISALTLQNGSAGNGAAISTWDEDLTLTDLALIGNTASGNGGALWADGFNMDLTIERTTFSGNSSGAKGGAIYVEDTGGPLQITDSLLANNSAEGDGGAIYFYDPDDDITIVNTTISGNTAGGQGGGIAVYDTDGGSLTIDRSTISGNTAAGGGGIHLYEPDHPATISNTTISGNIATGGEVSGQGGGILITDWTAEVTLAHNTIVGNSADDVGGGIAFAGDAGDSQLNHTIVAGNTAPIGPDIDLYDPSITADWSLVQDTTDVTLVGVGNMTGVDPQLGLLQDNGGPTYTHQPATTSPVVDAGNPDFAPPPTGDQRGGPRVAGPAIDIGAVELLGPFADHSATTAQDTPVTVAAPGVLADGRTGTGVTAALVTDAANGAVTVNADGSYTYTPDPGFFGTDTFTYQAVAAFGTAGTATVTITVTQAPPTPSTTTPTTAPTTTTTAEPTTTAGPTTTARAAADQRAATGSLPTTGSAAGPLAAVGAGLLGAGSAIVAASRRRLGRTRR